MRTIILLSSILLLSAAWAGTETGSSSVSQSNPASSDAVSSVTTVEGCLDGANGSYTLTDQGGTSYRLAGNLEPLKEHVGETMRISGTMQPVVHIPGAMSEGTEMRPTLLVSSYEKVSGVCGEDNNIH